MNAFCCSSLIFLLSIFFCSPLFALPELPRVYLSTDLSDTPSNGNTITVNAGDNLQQAINNALPGDTIVIEAGANFTGNFLLPPKSGGIPAVGLPFALLQSTNSQTNTRVLIP